METMPKMAARLNQGSNLTIFQNKNSGPRGFCNMGPGNENVCKISMPKLNRFIFVPRKQADYFKFFKAHCDIILISLLLTEKKEDLIQPQSKGLIDVLTRQEELFDKGLRKYHFSNCISLIFMQI